MLKVKTNHTICMYLIFNVYVSYNSEILFSINYLICYVYCLVEKKCVCLFVWLESAQRNYNKNNIGKGRLTERLLAQGLLTPNMLIELQKEWDKVSIHLP